MRERELLVLRHAKSAWDTDAESDFDRPLAKRGRKACAKVGAWIREEDILPDLVVSSPATRAEQTACRVLTAAGGDPETVVYDEAIYGGGIAEMLEILYGVPSTFRRVLVVGHNPGFEMFVDWLAADPIEVPEGKKLFPTAALARFAMPDDWRELDPGDGTLIDLVRARDL